MHVPHLGKKLKTLSAILILVLGIGIFAGIHKQSSNEPHIEYFDVDDANFVSQTKYIKRMEVWMVPVNADRESDWKTLGLMQRSSHWFSSATWELAIPEKPVEAMQIMVRGYDSSGTEVDRVSLPWIGPETLRREIWKIEN
jgi:hypothetical protein